MMTPTMHLRFVKRRVGANTVRILQQQWLEDSNYTEVWQDVPMADEKATQRTFPLKGD
jgi:hypothetical protein